VVFGGFDFPLNARSAFVTIVSLAQKAVFVGEGCHVQVTWV